MNAPKLSRFESAGGQGSKSLSLSQLKYTGLIYKASCNVNVACYRDVLSVQNLLTVREKITFQPYNAPAHRARNTCAVCLNMHLLSSYHGYSHPAARTLIRSTTKLGTCCKEESTVSGSTVRPPYAASCWTVASLRPQNHRASGSTVACSTACMFVKAVITLSADCSSE